MKNRTLLERVRCMLPSSSVCNRFWGEAVSTSTYLINKCPSSGIKSEMPDERWYGGISDYSGLRLFGCKAFALLKQGKLNARALRCIMLGYQKGLKGYRLWCTETGIRKVTVSRDVTFIEDQMPCLAEKVSGSTSSQKNDTQFKEELEPNPPEKDKDESPVGGKDGVDSDNHDQRQSQHEDLTDNRLARDRLRRTNTKLPARFVNVNLVNSRNICCPNLFLQKYPTTLPRNRTIKRFKR